MKQPRKKHCKLVFGLLSVVFGMLLFSFALVPLYDTFCEMTGINDKGGRVRAEIPTQVDTSRTVSIKFITHVDQAIKATPWTFAANEQIISLHPGEVKKMTFHFQNLSSNVLNGSFVATVAPGIGARYVKKTECFSFDRQRLEPFENKEISVVFFIDKALPADIKELTLFYSLFNPSGAQDDTV